MKRDQKAMYRVLSPCLIILISSFKTQSPVATPNRVAQAFLECLIFRVDRGYMCKRYNRHKVYAEPLNESRLSRYITAAELSLSTECGGSAKRQPDVSQRPVESRRVPVHSKYPWTAAADFRFQIQSEVRGKN